MGGMVAFQGELGAFSHEACLAFFGSGVRLLPQPTFAALFEAVTGGAADRGVVPIENSLFGSIHENFDRLLGSPLHIVGETHLRIRHCLIARPASSVEGLRLVRSHPVALGQCREFLLSHPRIEAIPAYDTAGAVKDLMSRNATGEAAIASTLAAVTYGAEVLLAGIEDDPQNFTRFLVVARQPDPVEREDTRAALKTTLAFGLEHAPGALHRALGVFASRGLDLTKIESRPRRGRPWEYVFYLDVVGSPEGPLAGAIQELGSLARDLRVLGTYPEAIR